MNASVTVFPLVFTAIHVRTIKTVAQWRLQRGTTLRSVEQLLGSRSLFGALQVLWSLRVLDLLGLAALLLAVISPLGVNGRVRGHRRPAGLVNTYYMSSLSPWTLMAGGGAQAGVSANFSATADLVVKSDIYVCQRAWWAVFVCACLVMVATAGLAAALTYVCPGPDILGFVSTMARDSPHVHVAAGGSALDGADRARLLKGLRVQLQDVQGEEELGKMAFVSPQGRPKPLRVDRLYV
ncbi:hypothetical protein B0T18DRAFT_447398 [Schizothecium vesticola]|uniref:Uncharacterized protein n=1 Tax=Schizothecium vesticola TaxID=314040 RepID=A0AA40K6C5_9PEZI|nr:hypothetical protein B0T18DRAFT_447398 [Schizothecium vesticola]